MASDCNGNISSESRRFDSVPGEQFSPEKSYIFFFFFLSLPFLSLLPNYTIICTFLFFLSFSFLDPPDQICFISSSFLLHLNENGQVPCSPLPDFLLLKIRPPSSPGLLSTDGITTRSGLVGSWRSTVMDNISSKSRRFDSVL
ncbi:hypothetical protein HDV57DRAFT_189580 [Trichoderma longibrachiatum]